MENVSKALGIGRDLVIIAFLVLVVAWYGTNESDKLRVILVEQQEHKGLIERLFERVDKLQKQENERHEGLLERLKLLEKKRGDVGAEQ
jgi:hypothetical protein